MQHPVVEVFVGEGQYLRVRAEVLGKKAEGGWKGGLSKVQETTGLKVSSDSK